MEDSDRVLQNFFKLGLSYSVGAASMVLRDRPQVLYIFGNLINRRKNLGDNFWFPIFFRVGNNTQSTVVFLPGSRESYIVNHQ